MISTDVSVIDSLGRGLVTSLAVAAVFTIVVLWKSVFDFTRTGPQMTDEVLSHYRMYLTYSLARLGAFAFLITSSLAFIGVTAYVLGLVLSGARYRPLWAAGASTAAILVLTGRLFVRTLLLSPGVLASSSLYSMTRFFPLWTLLTPGRLRALDCALFGTLGVLSFAAMTSLAMAGAWAALWLIGAIAAVSVAVPWWATRDPEPGPARTAGKPSRPNILLIGSDTLRADRLTGSGYFRELTPIIDGLAKRGVRFTDCYVPCARTAPSLASLFTGTWPHTHGVRDTFVTRDQTRLPIAALPEILKRVGYRTSIVGDWAASDAEKFPFGFEYKDLPPDQWNIKYLLRQGPKDIRLLLSLFTQNRFGKIFLPEVHFLGGHPLTEEVGRDTRRMIAKLADSQAPFFLVSFMATTHPPFTSKYPYYSLYASPEYKGESKFGMAKVRDPWEIIRRQGEPKTEFDLEQIIDLYDGCVKNFDDEVGRILDYLKASGIEKDTIVVVFSDHGFEFFEHGTWGQGNSAVGDFSARVPLIIADPRLPAGKAVSDPVRTVDIAPTLLDLIELPVPGYMEGASLAPLMRGDAIEEQRPAFYETGVWLTDLPGSPATHLRYPSLPDLLEVPDKGIGMICLKQEYVDIVIAAKDRMVRLGDWKLSYEPLADGPLYKLFNIREDAACSQDVLAWNLEVATQLRLLLEAWMAPDAAGASAASASAEGTGNASGAFAAVAKGAIP
jgi:arylsulfatase A-like enzyme